MLFFVFLAVVIVIIEARRFPLGRHNQASVDPLFLCGHQFAETWHRQPVDHFNFQQHRFYDQRVLVNKDHFEPSKPVILFYTGNEGTIEGFANNTGFMCEIASEFKAMLVFAEHRYFGKSMPFGDNSYQPENLGFLSVEQALADFAKVITNIKDSLEIRDAAVVSFGGSYGGMLSAWFRVKYPHIIDGAIAASAPILQFEGMVPNDIFDDIVTRTFESARTGCSSAIREFFHRITITDLNTLTEQFQLCKPLQDRNDLVNWISSALIYEAMVDYPVEANFIQPLPAWPVNVTCDRILDENHNSKPLQRFAKGVSVFYNYTGAAGHCFDIDAPASTSLEENGWNYLSCTSMMMPMSSGKNSMFPAAAWDYLTNERMCYQSYGIVPSPDFAALEFGGDRLSAASNIVFSNGELDPWSGGGVRHSLSSSISAILIEGAAHHLDLRGSDPTDSQAVKNARDFHRRHIRQWIQQVEFRYSSHPKNIEIRGFNTLITE